MSPNIKEQLLWGTFFLNLAISEVSTLKTVNINVPASMRLGGIIAWTIMLIILIGYLIIGFLFLCTDLIPVPLTASLEFFAVHMILITVKTVMIDKLYNN